MITRVSWLEIKVTDMKKSVAFYRDILGLKIKKEWPYYVIFDLPGTLTFALMLGGKKGRKEGAPNVYLAVGDLDAEYKVLKEKGVNFIEAPKSSIGAVTQPCSQTQTRTCSTLRKQKPKSV